MAGKRKLAAEDSATKIRRILSLYFKDHLVPSVIAKRMDLSANYINRVIKDNKNEFSTATLD